MTVWTYSKIFSLTLFFSFYNFTLWCVFKHQQPHRCIFGVSLQKHSPQWELELSFEARQNERSWFCVDVSECWQGKLWYEVCPLRLGWMMMIRHRSDPSLEEIRGAVWRAAEKSVPQLLVADEAEKSKRGLLLIDGWLGSFWVFVFLLFFWVVWADGCGQVSHRVCWVVKRGQCCSQAGESIWTMSVRHRPHKPSSPPYR